jgi:sterol desaturase/sphingolipid hydroxylase (fatty acid hydroxylase superfamily)
MFRQAHHAPKQLDATGAFVFHSIGMLIYTALGLGLNVLLLGLHPVAAAIVGFAGWFNTVRSSRRLAMALMQGVHAPALRQPPQPQDQAA